MAGGQVFFRCNLNVIVFFDGQNIYRSAKDAWHIPYDETTRKYTWPCYDVRTLSEKLTIPNANRCLTQIRFYTGVPSTTQNIHWHDFWINKLQFLRSRDIEVYKGRINESGQEKGVDVKITIDLIHLTFKKQFDIAIIVSQDRDFEPAVKLSKEIAAEQNRYINFESHYIIGNLRSSKRGIPGTIWKPIDKNTFDACYDTNEYRN